MANHAGDLEVLRAVSDERRAGANASFGALWPVVLDYGHLEGVKWAGTTKAPPGDRQRERLSHHIPTLSIKPLLIKATFHYYASVRYFCLVVAVFSSLPPNREKKIKEKKNAARILLVYTSPLTSEVEL